MLGQNGHPLLTDERVFVFSPGPNRYQASTLSDVVKLSQEAQARFVRDLKPQSALCLHGGELYFKLSACGLAFQAQTPVSALCSLEIAPRPETSWEPMSAAQAVSGLFPVTMPIGKPEHTRVVFSFLMQMLKAVPCFKVRVGSEAALAVKSFRELAAQLT